LIRRFQEKVLEIENRERNLLWRERHLKDKRREIISRMERLKNQEEVSGRP